MAVARQASLEVAPGSIVVVRDEEWLVTAVQQTQDGALLTVQGITELVRDTTAMFYEGLDDIEVVDPRTTRVVGDSSPRYRSARLWLEATIRKTPLPIDDQSMATSAGALIDPLDYQRTAVTRALDPTNLRPRILLADAVGLGKTMEIGMILAELVRRGRGERILIVTPRHVLEQMQHELWSRFALPFVRLDSVGIQRIRQQLPATRNPFSLYKRAIISIDTLKSERYINHLRRHRWDAVVIDESHNITNSATQNNRLATVLAPNTDALILASATPHNGKQESFAELIRLLEPSAVDPAGDLIESEVRRLVIRRHRHSPEVAAVVGADWAERREPHHVLIAASPQEDAVADELVQTWLGGGSTAGSGLFGWTLAKAFLSSPAALIDTCRNRLRTTKSSTKSNDERPALERLLELAENADGYQAKYTALREHLDEIGVSASSDNRVVIFAERIATLHWLAAALRKDLRLKDGQVAILHGGLTDVEQMDIVESFKQRASPVRILVTGDVASEGVNLHLQCHELVHYDIPWSLIRIEQRNGRIDRYGQKVPPRITTLLLQPSNEQFSGDLRVLTTLVDKEDKAHRALGDAASLMGQYSVEAEENAIRQVLAGSKSLDDVVDEPDEVAAGTGIAGLLARIMSTDSTEPQPVAETTSSPALTTGRLFNRPVDFLRDAVQHSFPQPHRGLGSGGIDWQEFPSEHIVQLSPPDDLRRRLEVLPQKYLSDRGVLSTFKLATTKPTGDRLLNAARADPTGSSWPEAHYLGNLHPVLDWVGDRALGSIGKHQVFAVRSTVDDHCVLLHGALTNRAGASVSSVWLRVDFPNPDNPAFATVSVHADAGELISSVGLHTDRPNAGPVTDLARLDALMPAAVDQARETLEGTFTAAEQSATRQVQQWLHRVDNWQHEADALIQRSQIRDRRTTVDAEKALAALRMPANSFVRPLLVVIPETPVPESIEGA